MGLSKHQEAACESIDASVFSSDMLFDVTSRQALSDYIGRWVRAINSHVDDDEESTQDVAAKQAPSVVTIPRELDERFAKALTINHTLDDSDWAYATEAWGLIVKEAEERASGAFPVEALPVPRIEVYEYKGYNGGFAPRRELMWRCDIIDISGNREFGGSWEDSGRGNPVKKYAEDLAEMWKKRTGWPVLDLGRKPEQDDSPRD